MEKAPKHPNTKSRNPAQTFLVVNPNAAGIDIGDTVHAVAVPPGSCPEDTETVRSFGTMTCDLKEIATWLKECHVDTVAMESTGVYWKPLFSLLNREGIAVCLVNARFAKNVSGRKTDESDAAWIQKLHSCGLLNSSYLPGEEQEVLRTLVRFRETLVADSSRFVLRMQKALELMNIKLHTVIRDITGKTGRAIVEAILAGEREPQNFLPLVHPRIQATKEEILKSLQGTWREEHLFTLRESYGFYCFFLNRIQITDVKIEEQLQAFEASQNDGELSEGSPGKRKPEIPKKKNKNNPKFDVRKYLHRILGVDAVAIYGMNELSGLRILAEIGVDMSKWPTEKHFISWLNLCPNNKISGGKLISSKVMKKTPSGAAQAFRAAANGLQRSDHWLGDYFRRMKAKGGNKYAIIATASKIATIYYKMVRTQTEFLPQNLEEYRIKNKQQKIRYLERKLRELKADEPD